MSIRSDIKINVGSRFGDFITTAKAVPDISLTVFDNADRLAVAAGFSSFTQLSDFFYHTETVTIYKIARLRICAGPDLMLAEMTDINDFTLSAAVINKNFTSISLYFFNKTESVPDVNDILNALPLYVIFAYKNAAVIHASQVNINGRSVLFSAPSGVGKTTQARLWQKNGAWLVSSDRSAIYRKDGVWKSRGYIIDGSSPEYCNLESNAAAVVFLSQSDQNTVERIDCMTAFKNILKQTFIEHQYPKAAEKTIGLLSEFVTETPVYHLSCTPTDEAVICLREALTADGVL